jgi:hypothetical protein
MCCLGSTPCLYLKHAGAEAHIGCHTNQSRPKHPQTRYAVEPTGLHSAQRKSSPAGPQIHLASGAAQSQPRHVKSHPLDKLWPPKHPKTLHPRDSSVVIQPGHTAREDLCRQAGPSHRSCPSNSPDREHNSTHPFQVAASRLVYCHTHK